MNMRHDVNQLNLDIDLLKASLEKAAQASSDVFDELRRDTEEVKKLVTGDLE